jgi:hypothetical protein
MMMVRSAGRPGWRNLGYRACAIPKPDGGDVTASGFADELRTAFQAGHITDGWRNVA